jgi:DNA polymerase delta subunit 1
VEKDLVLALTLKCTKLFNKVIQIGNVVIRQGEEEPFLRIVFTLKMCASIDGAQVLNYETEQEMLNAWSNFVRVLDPDIITGYNIIDFDIPYLFNRAIHLKLETFPYLGRIKIVRSEIRNQEPRIGSNTYNPIDFAGRCLFDLLKVLRCNYKFPSYSLNDVSWHFLRERKGDIHLFELPQLQNCDEQTRKEIAVYCLKDAYLPVKIINKLKLLNKYLKKSHKEGKPLSYLLKQNEPIQIPQ